MQKAGEAQYEFRHITFTAVKDQKWENVPSTGQIVDADFIKGNDRWIGVAANAQAGGVLTLVLRNQPQKLPVGYPQFFCHQGQYGLQDFEFLPYHSNYLATASGEIRFWHLPESVDALVNLQPILELKGHTKKVNLLSFNPSTAGLLASGSNDRTLRVWDVTNASAKSELFSYEGPQNQTPVSLQWNSDGKLLGSTWKDKYVRIWDPRSNQLAHEVIGHDSIKASRVNFLGSLPSFVSVGFNDKSKRQLRLWDMRNLSIPAQEETLGESTSLMSTYYDSDLGILYVTGRGDSNIQYFEYKSKLVRHANNSNLAATAKSSSFLPKYSLDTNNYEIAKVVKATHDSRIEVVSIVQPRRMAGVFYEEMYPPTAQRFSYNVQQWVAGQSGQGEKISLREGERRTDFGGDLQVPAGTATPAAAKPVQPVQAKPAQQQAQPVQAQAKPVVQQPQPVQHQQPQQHVQQQQPQQVQPVQQKPVQQKPVQPTQPKAAPAQQPVQAKVVVAPPVHQEQHSLAPAVHAEHVEHHVAQPVVQRVEVVKEDPRVPMLEAEIKKLREQTDNYNQTIGELRFRLKREEENVLQLKAHEESDKALKQSLEQQARTHADAVAQLQAQLKAQAEAAKVSATNNEEVLSLKQQIEVLKQQLSEKTQVLEITQQQLAEAHQQREEAHQQLGGVQQELAQTHEQHEHTQQQLAEAHQQREEAHQQLGELQQQVSEAQQQREEAHQQLSELQQQVAEVQQQREEAHQQLAEVQQQLAEVQQQLQDSHQQRDEVHQQLTEVQQQLAQTTQQQQQHEEPHQELSELQHQLAEAHQQREEAHQQLGEVKQLHEETQEQIRAHIAAEEELQQQLELTRQRLQELEQNQSATAAHAPVIDADEELGESQTGNNVLIVFAHPNSTNSWAAARRDAILEGLHEGGFNVVTSDLYRDDFDARISTKDFLHVENTEHFEIYKEQTQAYHNGTLAPILRREIKRLQWCDYLILITPFWWGSVSAILKGWFDRVLVPGFSYDVRGKIFGHSPLNNKKRKAWLVTSTGGPEVVYKPQGLQDFTLNDKLHHVTWTTLHFIGFNVIQPFNTYGIGHLTQEEQYKTFLHTLRETARNIADQPLLFQFGNLNENLGVVFKTAAVAQASAEEHHSAVHVDISPEAVEEIHKEVSELKALAENIEEVV